MNKVTEAIFSEGVLRPIERLDLREKERVRLTIEPIEAPMMDRQEAIRQFRAGQAETRFRSTGPYPTRDELHERN